MGFADWLDPDFQREVVERIGSTVRQAGPQIRNRDRKDLDGWHNNCAFCFGAIGHPVDRERLRRSHR